MWWLCSCYYHHPNTTKISIIKLTDTAHLSSEPDMSNTRPGGHMRPAKVFNKAREELWQLFKWSRNRLEQNGSINVYPLRKKVSTFRFNSSIIEEWSKLHLITCLGRYSRRWHVASVLVVVSWEHSKVVLSICSPIFRHWVRNVQKSCIGMPFSWLHWWWYLYDCANFISFSGGTSDVTCQSVLLSASEFFRVLLQTKIRSYL